MPRTPEQVKNEILAKLWCLGHTTEDTGFIHNLLNEYAQSKIDSIIPHTDQTMTPFAIGWNACIGEIMQRLEEMK